jgi:hypothetical protein
MERKPIKITLSFACYWLLKFFLAGKVGPIIGKIEYPGTQSGGGGWGPPGMTNGAVP